MSELTDEELAALIKRNDTHAECELYHRYYKKSVAFARRFSCNCEYYGIEIDDLVAVCFACVKTAVDGFSIEEKKSFHAYWKIVSRNAMLNYLKANTRDYHFNISLDGARYHDSDTVTLHDALGKQDDSFDDLNKAIASYIYNPKSNLSDEEALVAHYLYYREYSFTEIASHTGWKINKVYYLVSCTRKKISDYLKKRIFR